jgi:hypothetical protein
LKSGVLNKDDILILRKLSEAHDVYITFMGDGRRSFKLSDKQLTVFRLVLAKYDSLSGNAERQKQSNPRQSHNPALAQKRHLPLFPLQGKRRNRMIRNLENAYRHPREAAKSDSPLCRAPTSRGRMSRVELTAEREVSDQRS